MDELYLSLLKETSLDKEFAKRVLNTKLEVIGVKTPILKKIAKENLNYKFNNIKNNHCYEMVFLYFYINLFNLKKDINKQIEFIKNNINLIDSWAIVDSTVQLLENIDFKIIKYLVNEEEMFLRRYGFVSMLNLIKNKNNLEIIFSLIDSDERYYVLMAEGWLLSYGLIFHFEETFDFIKNKQFSLKIKQVAIQKAIDSYRVSSENKSRLKNLRKELKTK